MQNAWEKLTSEEVDELVSRKKCSLMGYTMPSQTQFEEDSVEEDGNGSGSGTTGFAFRQMNSGRKGRPAGYRASRWQTRPEPPKRAPKRRLDSARNQKDCERPIKCNAKFAVGNKEIDNALTSPIRPVHYVH